MLYSTLWASVNEIEASNNKMQPVDDRILFRMTSNRSPCVWRCGSRAIGTEPEPEEKRKRISFSPAAAMLLDYYNSQLNPTPCRTSSRAEHFQSQ